MEDQVLQHEMTDIPGKSCDSELGQNPINLGSHWGVVGVGVWGREKASRKICIFLISWKMFII